MRNYKTISALFSVLFVSAIILTGCSSSDPATPAASGNTNKTTTTNATAATGEVKEVSMEAKKFEFTPSTITVKKGDTVKLAITSTDVTHGFALEEFGVNENLQAGKTTNVEFVADKTGEFSFTCNVTCGSGHTDMKGTLIVE